MKTHIHPNCNNAEVKLAGINPIYEFLDGQIIGLNGVEGKLKLDVWVDRFGLLRYQLCHEATEKGKQTTRYQDCKQKLGDDYVTDITYDADLVKMAFGLGYQE